MTKKTYTPDEYSRQSGWLTIVALILMGIALFSNGPGPAFMLLCMFVLGVAAGTVATKAAHGRNTVTYPIWHERENERFSPEAFADSIRRYNKDRLQ
jgi:ABC-type xylose transport system permease subunit